MTPATDPRVDAHLAESPLVMILRGVRRDEILDVAEALIDGGIRLLEVTMNTDHALEILECLVDRYGDSQDVLTVTIAVNQTFENLQRMVGVHGDLKKTNATVNQRFRHIQNFVAADTTQYHHQWRLGQMGVNPGVGRRSH